MLCSFTARPKLVIKTYHFNTNLYFDPSLYLVILGGEFSKGIPPPLITKTTIIEKSLFYLKHDLKSQIKTCFMAICYLKMCLQETAYVMFKEKMNRNKSYYMKYTFQLTCRSI